MKKELFLSGLVALLVTIATIGVFSSFEYGSSKSIKIEHIDGSPATATTYTMDENGEIIPLDFTRVAEKVMDAVVHIRSTQTYPANNRPQFGQPRNPFDDDQEDPFRDFFNPRFFFRESPRRPQNQPRARVGQGSGVIISEDGYIVTNNHVIANADDLEVTLHDNRNYKATVIGTDPTTDLALIQIKEQNLPTIPFVDSDDVKVGEWVLAVGNPFNLTSTVTAGIVSAKGRNINILREQFAVESFIQTDAAINPGNSGGALVNLQSGLIGINTAIASPTGAYSGYGFAVPSNMVSKVVEDLIKYGAVQRGVLGIMIRTVDGNLQKEKDLELTTGVFVDSLLDHSAAAAAGLKPGDVITSVNGIEVKSSPELQEIIARHRPGDEVTLLINRNGEVNTLKVVLNNRRGNTELVEKVNQEVIGMLGADLEEVDKKAAARLDIQGGVKVKTLYAGKLRKQTNMREGFIITKVDGTEVSSVEQLTEALEGKKGGVMLEGIYEDIPGIYYYAFGM